MMDVTGSWMAGVSWPRRVFACLAALTAPLLVALLLQEPAHAGETLRSSSGGTVAPGAPGTAGSTDTLKIVGDYGQQRRGRCVRFVVPSSVPVFRLVLPSRAC